MWWESVGWWLNQLCKSPHVDSIFKPMIDLLSDYGKPLHSPIWCLSTNGVCLTHLLRKCNRVSRVAVFFSWIYFAFHQSTFLHAWIYITWSKLNYVGTHIKNVGIWALDIIKMLTSLENNTYLNFYYLKSLL